MASSASDFCESVNFAASVIRCLNSNLNPSVLVNFDQCTKKLERLSRFCLVRLMMLCSFFDHHPIQGSAQYQIDKVKTRK